MKTSLNFFLVAIFSIFFLSCKKTDLQPISGTSIKENNFNSAADIFKSTDILKLQSIIKSKDENTANIMINSIANEVTSYFYHKYKIDIRNDFRDNPKGVIVLGLFYAAKEIKLTLDTKKSAAKAIPINPKPPINPVNPAIDGMGCFMTAVSSVIGISQAQSIWSGIIGGASTETVIAALKLIGGRVATVITLAFAVYNVGLCMDWWDNTRPIKYEYIGVINLKLNDSTIIRTDFKNNGTVIPD